jgi:hypothetical protein
MKNYISNILCAAIVGVGTSNGIAQDQATPTAAAPLTPEPIEPAQPYAAAVNAYGLATGGLAPFGGGRAGQTLVIPKEASDPKGLADIEEDMSVMARILEKACGRDQKNQHAMGITVYGGGFSSSPAPRNFYIDGHGAIFLLNVNFPLVAPPAKPEAEPKESTSTEWEEARRELHRGGADSGFQWSTAPAIGFGGESSEDFDSEKVDDLKKNLISALKNAAHIRKLKADETVTVVVSGRGAPRGRVARTRSGGSAGTTTLWQVARPGKEEQGTKLILRAKKSDIDSFQRDKTSLEDFRKKVTTITY